MTGVDWGLSVFEMVVGMSRDRRMRIRQKAGAESELKSYYESCEHSACIFPEANNVSG